MLSSHASTSWPSTAPFARRYASAAARSTAVRLAPRGGGARMHIGRPFAAARAHEPASSTAFAAVGNVSSASATEIVGRFVVGVREPRLDATCAQRGDGGLAEVRRCDDLHACGDRCRHRPGLRHSASSARHEVDRQVLRDPLDGLARLRARPRR